MNQITKIVNCNNTPYDIYIGRPSIWGNPFMEGKDGSRQEVIKKYREWILYSDDAEEQRKEIETLRGKVLGCWCKPKACHGDILIEILNNRILDFL